MLAQTIQRAEGSLRFNVRGLRTRQHRMLRYLGLDLDTAEPRAAPAP